MARARASRWSPLPIVLAGTFMVVLDFFIVNVALPSMQSRLHASDGAIEWVVAGYSLTSAILLIAAGRLGDRHGRRRVFALGLALFTLSSAACGLAASPEMLVGARLVQGGAAALLMPNVLSLIGVLYDGADRARALAAYGMTMGLAAVSGQLIGGVLVQADIAGLGWRTVFLINVPVGALALALAPRLIPESRVQGQGRIDAIGTVLVTETVQLDPRRNPTLTKAQVEAELARTIGATHAVWLPRGLTRDSQRYGTRGHVDIVATIPSPGVLLVHSQRDPAHPDYAVSRQILDVLEGSVDARGAAWRIVEVPAPEVLTDAEGPVDYSYINHLAVNGGVIACGFGDPGDDTARGILADAYPGRRVVSVDARPLFARGGGIHCITQQQPSRPTSPPAP